MPNKSLLLCFAALFPMIAQDPPKEPQTDPVFKESVRYVLVPVTAMDHAGNFVPGLTPYDFRLSDNKKLQKITEDDALHPASIVLVIQANNDVSGVLPNIKKMGALFESLVMGDSGEMAVIGFDHRANVLTGFTSDPAQIDKAFQKLSVGGYTAALNDATMAAVNLLKGTDKKRRRVIIQIAENRDKGSQIGTREVLTELEFANVTVYAANISQWTSSLTSKAPPSWGPYSNLPPGAIPLPGGYVNTPTIDSQMAMGNWIPLFEDIFDATKHVFVPAPVDVYTRYTGGRELTFKTTKTMQHDVQEIGNEMHSQYLLSYVPNNQEEAGYHRITVEVLKPGLQVRAREGYWSAAKAQ
jgi:VWFA-related protein